MTNKQQAKLITAAAQQESVFIIGVGRIKFQYRVFILKYCGRLIEAHAMFAQIGLGLAGIPNETHDHSLST